MTFLLNPNQHVPPTIVESVENIDGTLMISPNTGAVIASLNTSHANQWNASQSFYDGLFFQADMGTRTLSNGINGNISLDWNNGVSNDVYGGRSVDAFQHQLVNEIGTVVMDWTASLPLTTQLGFFGSLVAQQGWDVASSMTNYWLMFSAYYDAANVVGTLPVGTGWTGSTSFNANCVVFSDSGANTLTYDNGFQWIASTHRGLFSNTSITPQSRLHIHDSGATAIETRYTNSATGSTSTDGLQVGITTTWVAEIRQRENQDIDFYVNNTKRGSFQSSQAFGFWLPCATAGTYWAFRTGNITSWFGYSLKYNDASDTLGYGAAYRHALQYSAGESFAIVGNGTTPHLVVADGGNIGMGTGTWTISAKLHLLKTTEQLRIGYDASNYTSFTTGSDGRLNIDSVSSSVTPGINFKDRIAVLGFGGVPTPNYNYTMQIAENGTQTYLQWSTNGSGHTPGDGFVLGLVDGTGVRYFNWENSAHIFYISAAEVLRFSPTGAVLQISNSDCAKFIGAGSTYGGTLRLVNSNPTDQEWMIGVGWPGSAVVNGKALFISDVTANTYPWFVDTSWRMGVGLTTNAATALADLAGSTTSIASLRIRSGTAPTSPNSGEIWFDWTDLKMRVWGTTKTFVLV